MEKSNYHSVNLHKESGAVKSSGNARLSTPVRKCFLSALETCVDALAIYHHTLMDPSCDDGVGDSGSGNKNVSLVTPKNSDRREMLCKLERDSMYVRQLLEDVKSEMTEVGTYVALIKLIEESGRREIEESDTMLNYAESYKIVEGLKRELEDEIIDNEREVEVLMAELHSLREEKQKIEEKTEREMRYASAWERTQCEDSNLRSSITLEQLRASLQDCLILKKNECRVAREIEAFLRQNIAFNVKASDNWEERYNREMQMYTEKNNQLREDIECRRRTLGELEAKFRERQEFIDQYLAEKEAARIEREREEHKTNSAIQIQAWWRGVMVRRKLGPYRPDEKKKKKGKGKK